jgi:anti-anti-sigma factor
MPRHPGWIQASADPQAAPHALAVPLVEVSIAEGLNIGTLPRLSSQLDRVLELSPRHLVIDLTDCPYVDAAAIVLLLDVHRRMWRADAQLSVRAPTARLRKILRAARVDHVLHLVPEEPDPPHPPPPDAAPATTARSRATARGHAVVEAARERQPHGA